MAGLIEIRLTKPNPAETGAGTWAELGKKKDLSVALLSPACFK